MIEVFVVDGVRTPQGRYGGALAGVRPDDLAALAVAEAVRRSGVAPDAAAGWSARARTGASRPCASV